MSEHISFSEFAAKMVPSISLTPFHSAYYRILDIFAKGKIRKLIVTIPPQHGKSLGSSILLPSYLLGLDPDCRVAIASYSASLAQKFNKRVQRLIDSPVYFSLFPETTIKGSGKQSGYIRTSELVEVIGHSGEIMAVGREGSLTGNSVDIFIIDDLYKDAMEANSPTVRENCWDWYTSVVKTRMHNSSQELIVFTRWHKEDLIGSIMGKERVVELKEWAQIETLSASEWIHFNLEAIKESPATELDNREKGEALWAEQHSTELLEGKRKLDSLRFECMYQGHPSDVAGLLYGDNFLTYNSIPDDIISKANYTDTADTGDDYLCSICYYVDTEGVIYIKDIVYSRERMEITEVLTSEMLKHCKTQDVLVESNNGGRGFARTIQKLVPKTNVEWFHQSANKEARILSNSSTVVRNILMPKDWKERWSEFASHILTYNRNFRSNRWHDAPDVLTGIIERECTKVLKKRIKSLKYRS